MIRGKKIKFYYLRNLVQPEYSAFGKSQQGNRPCSEANRNRKMILIQAKQKGRIVISEVDIRSLLHGSPPQLIKLFRVTKK